MGKGGLSWLSNVVGDVFDGVKKGTANRMLERVRKEAETPGTELYERNKKIKERLAAARPDTLPNLKSFYGGKIGELIFNKELFVNMSLAMLKENNFRDKKNGGCGLKKHRKRIAFKSGNKKIIKLYYGPSADKLKMEIIFWDKRTPEKKEDKYIKVIEWNLLNDSYNPDLNPIKPNVNKPNKIKKVKKEKLISKSKSLVSRDDSIKELKNLKELLDLELITKAEFDKKSK
ncbi:hypothetical protein N8351_04840, partial [Flavobacteriaceae bacterium]|nr:hypothetical protein [Flavobacteriaceae bacterium]